MGGFMVPVVYPGEVLGVEYTNGESETIEIRAFRKVELDAARALVMLANMTKGGVAANVQSKIRPIMDFLTYPGVKIERVTIIKGWIGYASAPGYLDRTDPQVFDTEAEAMEHAREAAGEMDEDPFPRSRELSTRLSTLGGKVKP